MVLLGSTGSVGTQAADVIRRNPGRFRVTGLAAGGGNPDLLAAQAIEFGAGVVAVAQESALGAVREALKAHAGRAGRPRTGPPPTALTGQRLAPPARPGPPPAGGHGLSATGGDGRAPLPTVLAGADASSQRLARATGGHVDLAVEAHRLAAISWLRSWGCRHLRRADTPLTSQALRTWWDDWGAQLPGDHETLTGLGEAGLVVAGRAYAALRAAPAARRSVKGRDLDVAFGDTATAKLLFAIRPQIFPPWDEAIRLAFGRPGGADAYVRMLRLSAAALDGLAERLAVGVSDLPQVLGRPASSPPKLVDEFLLIRITRDR